ncbi:MAG: DUF2934 domain-containing protein [Pseudomonadota bacterium]
MIPTGTASPRRPPPSEDQIRQRAYFLWLERGGPEGEDRAFWYAAEQQLLEDQPAAAPDQPASAANVTDHYSIRHTLADHRSDPTHRFHAPGVPHDDRLDVIAGEARQRVRGRRFDNSLRAQPKSPH